MGTVPHATGRLFPISGLLCAETGRVAVPFAGNRQQRRYRTVTVTHTRTNILSLCLTISLLGLSTFLLNLKHFAELYTEQRKWELFAYWRWLGTEPESIFFPILFREMIVLLIPNRNCCGIHARCAAAEREHGRDPFRCAVPYGAWRIQVLALSLSPIFA